jgi:hypothetical protein
LQEVFEEVLQDVLHVWAPAARPPVGEVAMRSAGNFSPEWGYLAPAPSFMRTARIVLVATAIGATAGAGVVLSLVDHPAADGQKTALAAQAIVVTSVQAATGPTAPVVAPAPVVAIAPGDAATNVVARMPAAQTKLPKIPAAAPRPATMTPPQIPAAIGPGASAGEVNSVAAPQPAPGIAALTDSPSGTTDAAPADLPDGTTLTPDTTLPKKTTKHTSNGTNQSPPGLGTTLRRIFSDHAGASYFPNRGL